MTTHELGKHKIEIYDNIEELPMRRFHLFNKMLLIDSGIGSDLADFDKHMAKARSFVIAKKNEQALTELDNLRQNYFFVMEGISPKYLAFSALIAKVDGKEFNPASDGDLHKVINELGDVDIASLNKVFEEAKKKIDDALMTYFPAMFDDAKVKEFFDILKKRTLLLLDGIINEENEERDGKLEELDLALITFINPSKFVGSESQEIVYEKNFDKMCHIIAHYLNTNPKNYTVTEFYSAYDYVQDLIKADVKSKQIKFK